MPDATTAYTIDETIPPVQVPRDDVPRLLRRYGMLSEVQALRRLVVQLMRERGEAAKAAEEIYDGKVILDRKLNEVAEVFDEMRDCQECRKWAGKGPTPFCSPHALKLGGLLGDRIPS